MKMLMFLVADLLRARGFDAITARDVGRLHTSDVEQFAYAVSQARNFGCSQQNTNSVSYHG